jgi:hypothetical protein
LSPYPGLPPNLSRIPVIGGLTRTCLVVELRSLGELTPSQVALVSERLDAYISNLLPSLATVESVRVASQDCFDPVLMAALRLQKG